MLQIEFEMVFSAKKLEALPVMQDVAVAHRLPATTPVDGRRDDVRKLHSSFHAPSMLADATEFLPELFKLPSVVARVLTRVRHPRLPPWLPPRFPPQRPNRAYGAIERLHRSIEYPFRQRGFST